MANAQHWTDSIITDLKSEYSSQGRKASGNWANLLSSKITETENSTTIEIYGASYTQWMEEGREPNSNQDNVKGFAAWASNPEDGFIYNWCQDKGISTTAAFPIALKIGKEGFDGKPLVSKVISAEKIKELMKGVVGTVQKETIQKLKYGNY